MKKIILILLILLITASLFALKINPHLGILSGVGISFDVEKWNLGVDYESTIPFYAIGSGIIAVYYDECSFLEGCKLGAFYFRGLDLFAYRELFSVKNFALSAGLNILSGFEFPIKKFESVIKGGIKLDFKTGDKTSIFAMGNLPFLCITMAKGFSSPYTRVPSYNKFSMATGCKIGMSFKIN